MSSQETNQKKLKLHIRPERANRYECSAENWGLPDECGRELEVFVKVVKYIVLGHNLRLEAAESSVVDMIGGGLKAL